MTTLLLICAVVTIGVLQVRNFRAVKAVQAKLRVDTARLIRETWQEAQDCLIAEGVGAVVRIEDYLARTDRVNHEEEGSHGSTLADSGGGSTETGSEPKDGTHMD